MSRASVIAGAAVIIVAAALAPKVTGKMADFEVYWTAANRARTAAPLYRLEDGHYQFKYLPAFAILAIPIGFLPLDTAKAVWFATSVMLLVVLIATSVRLLPELRKLRWIVVGVLIVALGKFFGHELVLGQVNILFGVVVLAALAAMKRGHELTAGSLIALAIIVKPYAILFVPWLIARGQPRSIVSAAAGLVATLALPSVTYGASGAIAAHEAWWRTVADSTAPNLTNPDNVSIAAMYTKWFGASALVMALTLVTTLGLLGVAGLVFSWRKERMRFPEGLEAAFLLTLVPMLSPQGWDYVFLVSTLAIAYLVNYEDRLPRPLRALTIAAVAAIGLSLYDVMGRAAYSAFMSWSIITVCYLVVLSALVSLRLRGAA